MFGVSGCIAKITRMSRITKAATISEITDMAEITNTTKTLPFSVFFFFRVGPRLIDDNIL